jgi:hypothetical protein
MADPLTLIRTAADLGAWIVFEPAQRHNSRPGGCAWLEPLAEQSQEILATSEIRGRRRQPYRWMRLRRRLGSDSTSLGVAAQANSCQESWPLPPRTVASCLDSDFCERGEWLGGAHLFEHRLAAETVRPGVGFEIKPDDLRDTEKLPKFGVRGFVTSSCGPARLDNCEGGCKSAPLIFVSGSRIEPHGLWKITQTPAHCSECIERATAVLAGRNHQATTQGVDWAFAFTDMQATDHCADQLVNCATEIRRVRFQSAHATPRLHQDEAAIGPDLHRSGASLR